MIKKVSVFLAALLVCVSFASCSQSKAKAIDVAKVADDLLTKIAYKDELSKLTDDMFQSVYALDSGTVKKAVAYTSSGATAEEITAIEANSESDVPAIKEALNNRLAYQKEGYADYGPKEVPKLNDAVIITSGKYVFMSVSDDSAGAKSIINSNLS